MIRKLAARILPYTNFSKISYISSKNRQSYTFSYNKSVSHGLTNIMKYQFAELPRHDVLSMPALSPTMTEGKIIKWTKNIGDKVTQGDVICQIQTDKATVGFQVQQSGYLAQIKNQDGLLPVGTPLAVIVKKSDQIKPFEGYDFRQAFRTSKLKQIDQPPKEQPKQEKKSQTSATASQASSAQSYPKHQKIKMPSLSPTMTQGQILKWLVKQGQQYNEGDALCEIETDKSTMAFEANSKGVLAKIVAPSDKKIQVGDTFAISVKKKADVEKFKDYKETGKSSPAPNKQQHHEPQKKSAATHQQPKKAPVKQSSSGNRVFASPAAKTLAAEKGINLSDIGSGSGPQGRIIKQDVQNFSPKQTSTTASTIQTASKLGKQEFPQNPFEQIAVNSMRKTIASRLTQSKTTIPHYYVSLSIQMDAISKLRAQLNANQNQNGVKISVNDIILKAMALALRDYPIVNSQWHGNVIKRFKHSDVSVAVATDGGLITPIVYRAETLGLVDIAKRTKDIAKRARQGKLDPRQFAGGTSTISNLGMFGIDSVTSVINPPQSTILGIGKTQKKILYDEKSLDPNKPYRVAQVMQVIVSADHRVVDGAVAAQWLTRIKKYLENPTQMLL